MEEKKKSTKSRYGKYARTVDEFLRADANVGKINREKASIHAVYTGLDRAIKKDYTSRVFLSIIDGEIYLEKILKEGELYV